MMRLINKRVIKALGIILLGSCLSACKEAELAQEAPIDWVQEEILQQLSELRGEVKTLKDQVASLQGQIERGGRGGLATSPGQVKLSSGAMLGNVDASIAIVEFTDYQCPYCARHNSSVLPAIREKLINTGRAKYVTYDFPLNFHPQADAAAVAARCAGRQGRFWEMHEILFKNQRNLNAGLFHKAAGDLQLDSDAFGACLQDPGMLAEVEADKRYGTEIGVGGTPKFYVGKVQDDVIIDVIVINGAQGYAAFSNAIERLEKI